MRKNFTLTLSILLLFLFENFMALGQNDEIKFHLIRDINQSKNSNPFNYNYQSLPQFATIDSIIYFNADDGMHNSELWRSDGTAPGTFIVKDISTGKTSAEITCITSFKGKIYFQGSTPENGSQIYMSDGTESGTVILKKINPHSVTFFDNFTVVKNKLFFHANMLDGSDQLWVTDGTSAGTLLIKDMSLSGASRAWQLTAVDNLLFFTALSHAYGNELWRSDGTSSGTFMIRDINPILDYEWDDNGPDNLTSFGNIIYFSAFDGTARKLWRSDGSNAGTYPVTSNNISLPRFKNYTSNQFAVAQNCLFFPGYHESTGIELYKYDPSKSEGIKLVKDIVAGSKGSNLSPGGMRAMNNNIYFAFTDSSVNKFYLYKSDGTSANTKIVQTLPGPIDSYNFYSIASRLYFTLPSSVYGKEVWTSDGTTKGTKMLKDINPNNNGSNPSYFTACKDKIFFTAYNVSNGAELWATKNTTASTKIVKDINVTTTASGINFSYDPNFENAIPLDSNQIVFLANTPETGTELWKSDGVNADLIKDIIPGEISSSPRILASKNGKIYFSTINPDDNSFFDMYVTNGTSAGTKKLTTVHKLIYQMQVADNGRIFYSWPQIPNVYGTIELWTLDSNGVNTLLCPDINTNSTNFCVVGNTCYFPKQSNYDIELWKATGTTTAIVKNINTYSSSEPQHFTAFGNKLLFTAIDNTNTRRMWITNGTSSGTKFLKDISAIGPSAMLNNKMYFSGTNAQNGLELFCTNGTTKGTTLVKDIVPGTGSSSPEQLTVAGSFLYFVVDDNIHGKELWSTTGVTSGTKLVKDVTPGISGTFFSTLAGTNSKLYFINNFSTLFESNGSEAGTHPVNDSLFKDINWSPWALSTGNKLFFVANNYQYGSELYSNYGGAKTQKAFDNSLVQKKLPETSFSAKLINNPFNNKLQIDVTSSKEKQLKIVVVNSAGQSIAQQSFNISSANHQVIINSQKWAGGTYFINVISKSGMISLTAVK